MNEPGEAYVGAEVVLDDPNPRKEDKADKADPNLHKVDPSENPHLFLDRFEYLIRLEGHPDSVKDKATHDAEGKPDDELDALVAKT